MKQEATCLQKGAALHQEVRKTGKTFPALLTAARVHDVDEEEGSSV
jgi:hypothetical protein